MIKKTTAVKKVKKVVKGNKKVQPKITYKTKKLKTKA